MSNWLNTIVKEHSELESPENFWRWGALAALSAVVKDNVWMSRQIHNMYPNIYVMLHADSGMKKGPPVSMARKLCMAVGDIRIISGRSSIQGILKKLGTGQTEPGGKIQKGSTAFICSSELSSSLVDDPVATKILTDLYDRQYNVGDWESLLKTEGFKLTDPTLSMLTATNEAMSEGFFTKSAVQGGYFARTFIIYEKEAQAVNSLSYPLDHAPNVSASIDYLKEVAKLRGPFKSLGSLVSDNDYRYHKSIQGRDIYFTEAGIIYENWYHNFKEIIKEQEVKDETGTMNRFGDSILKVAMLYSLAESPILDISGQNMDIAIAQCEKLLGNVRKTTMGKNAMSESSNLKTLIINELLARDSHQVTRTVLLRKMLMNIGSQEEFDDMMMSFHQSGMIVTENIGTQIVFRMPSKEASEIQQFLSGKNRS